MRNSNKCIKLAVKYNYMKSSVNFVSLDFNYTRFFENIITKKLQETRKKVELKVI